MRPPRLGGNTRVGVFATRSPFRPNPLGLSSVKLEAIEQRPDVGPVLIVRGADLMDGTPIYDIKPYIPYADCTRTPPRLYRADPHPPSGSVLPGSAVADRTGSRPRRFAGRACQ